MIEADQKKLPESALECYVGADLYHDMIIGNGGFTRGLNDSFERKMMDKVNGDPQLMGAAILSTAYAIQKMGYEDSEFNIYTPPRIFSNKTLEELETKSGVDSEKFMSVVSHEGDLYVKLHKVSGDTPKTKNWRIINKERYIEVSDDVYTVVKTKDNETKKAALEPQIGAGYSVTAGVADAYILMKEAVSGENTKDGYAIIEMVNGNKKAFLVEEKSVEKDNPTYRVWSLKEGSSY